MRYGKEHKERTRQRLLAEAAKAIRAEGPEQLGVASLMSRLGLTHGGFYAHFKSKDELVDKALEASFGQAVERFARSVEGRSPAEGLAAYVGYYLSMSHVERRDAGCPIPALSADMSRTNGPGRARFASGIVGLAERMAALLEKIGTPAEEAILMARSAMAEMVGAVALARAATDPIEAGQIVEASRQSVLRRLGISGPE